MSDPSKDSKDGILSAPAQILREKSAVAARLVRRASEDVGDLARRTARNISGTGAQAWDSLRDKGVETTEALLRASKDWTSGLLPETRVQTLLLPTGGGTADFVCVLDFKDVVEQLAGGRFTRPCLEVWAAREDVNRLALAANLRHEFTSQLQAERDNLRRAAEKKALPRLQTLDAEKSKAGNLVETATFGLTSSLLLMFTIANPIFNLVFLVLAIFSGAGGLTKALRYIQLTLRIRNDEKDLEMEQRELENELDARNQEFRSAVDNLEVKVHPVLERVLVDICDLDGKPYVPGGSAEEEEVSPAVGEHLRAPRYRAAVPEVYHSLIDAETA